MLDVNDLISAMNHLIEGDPLLRRGIKRDWVCVINPAMVQPIRELEKQLTAFPSGDLNRITGRETWIFNSAPRTEVQYMTREAMVKLYADELAAEARLAAMRKEQDAAASADAARGSEGAG